MRRIVICGLGVGALAWLWLAQQALAAQSPETPLASDQGTSASALEEQAGQNEGSAAPSRLSLWGLLRFLAIVDEVLIGLVSIAALALAIEHFMAIREGVLMPPGLDEDVRGLVAARKLSPAADRCRAEPSFLSHVLRTGLAEADGDWAAVEKAVEDATAEQSARLFRKIEYLSVIGNIAPMMGLLGTVFGIMLTFHELAATQGAPRAADLAEGIFLALRTTAEGLIVAILSLAAFAVLRNRVDHLAAEVTYVADQVLGPLKRKRGAAPPQSPPKAPRPSPPKAPRPSPPKAPPQVPPPPPVGGRN